jgi:hypothetical protein
MPLTALVPAAHRQCSATPTQPCRWFVVRRRPWLLGTSAWIPRPVHDYARSRHGIPMTPMRNNVERASGALAGHSGRLGLLASHRQTTLGSGRRSQATVAWP